MSASEFDFNESQQVSVIMSFNERNMTIFCNGIIAFPFIEYFFKPCVTEKLSL